MDIIHQIDIENFNYKLPQTSIATYPLPDRSQSNLLLYESGRISHQPFSRLPGCLPEGSWLVFNNTRVIQARLQFRKPTGARIEIFCLEPVNPVDYQQSFQSNITCTWSCLVGNAKKWKSGKVSLETSIEGAAVILEASLITQMEDSFIIEFRWNNPHFTFGEIIENSGTTPIPPYLNRDAEESDKERYQTIYCQANGSVAAPTAGLHFTREMLQQLNQTGVRTEELTLHVGAGTFVPVKTDNARNHTMHAEQVVVSKAFLEKWFKQPEGLIAVGTTSTRSLESLYWLGVKYLAGERFDPSNLEIVQWEDERHTRSYTLKESLEVLIDFSNKNELEHLHFSTRLMIVPGYRFRSISGLITNFHLPGSTLLLLIAALIGEDWKKVYEYALQQNFRFLSYGDSSLILPEK